MVNLIKCLTEIKRIDSRFYTSMEGVLRPRVKTSKASRVPSSFRKPNRVLDKIFSSLLEINFLYTLDKIGVIETGRESEGNCVGELPLGIGVTFWKATKSQETTKYLC